MTERYNMENQENLLDKIIEKIQGNFRRLGVKIIYMVLLLFYAYKQKDTPGWAKSVVLSALGYFIMPFDLNPDISPITGFLDDLGMLSFALVNIATYITMEVKISARKKLKQWFDTIDLEELKEIEDRISNEKK